jgi:hypothetical protein
MARLRVEMEEKLELALSEAEKSHRAEILGMVVQHNSEIQKLEGERTAMATSLEGLRKKYEEYERKVSQEPARHQQGNEANSGRYETEQAEPEPLNEDAVQQPNPGAENRSPLVDASGQTSDPSAASPGARYAPPRKKTDPPPPLQVPSPEADREPTTAEKAPAATQPDAWRLDENDRITYEPKSDETSAFWKKGSKGE